MSMVMVPFMMGLPMAFLTLALDDWDEEPRGVIDTVMRGFAWFVVAGFVVTAVVGIALSFSGAF